MSIVDDVRAALRALRNDTRRRRPGFAIPPARDLPDGTFLDVGLSSDREVAELAWTGMWSAWHGHPIHPRYACAIRVAWARSGRTDPEDITNPALIDWVSAHLNGDTPDA